MKKAIIKLGASQAIVSEGDVITAPMVIDDKKLTVPALAVIEGGKINLGAPEVKGVKVELEVTDAEARADKVTAVRYKAKKRVLKVRGHKQKIVELKVKSIA